MINERNLYLNSDPDSSEKPEMERLLNISFRAHGLAFKESPRVENKIHWNESFFQLSATNIWKELNESEKNIFLQRMNCQLLKEAYYIENAGMLYTGKMNILSETEAERAFFCVMGQEEASHLEMFRPFLPNRQDLADIPTFSKLIGKIITDGDRRSNLFLIQVLLEGWGLSYYQSLLDHTQNSRLQDSLRMILNDESRHHSAGVLLFESTKTHQADSFLMDSLVELLEMIRIGPWTVISELLRLRGDLSKSDILTLLTQMNACEDAQKKMNRLKKLTERSLPTSLLQNLESKNIWNVYPHEIMAAAHFSRA